MGGVTRAAVVGALIVAAGVAVAGCASSGPAGPAGPAQSASSGPSAPSNSAGPAGGSDQDARQAGNPTSAAQQARSQLLAKVPGQQAFVVSVPSGYDGITYDQRGHVGFWSDGSAGWQESAVGSYPYFAGAGERPSVRATGALLSGMRHATFVLTGSFSEDGTGNAVGYTAGSSGWGVIVAQPSGNLAPASPNVDSRNSGVSYGLTLTGGRLETEDCPPNQALAMCGGSDTVKKLWRWTGTQFVRIR